ncbi:SAM-dependent methyltransferase [Paraburkholderia sp. HD33-4]|uniref:SAM-dependent methyltransferase n=1 Tax=Paraburkholderia sp. HD33-4 TaxID=2883242 RepID=UPI001F229142|nr:cyclopropane-fatty-acyl-phospholipid synthase family protein [Paraburkholderia sp. HD33-4]
MTQFAQTSPGASPDAIQFHYDVSNDFYAAWLDSTMTYSAAMFDSGGVGLEQAQIRKLDYHLESAGASGAARILDVGCGWGSLLKRSVDWDVRHAVGLTLSRAQLTYIEGHSFPNVEVRLESWRDHSSPTPYDAIVCIGAFEHFVRFELSATEKIRAYRDFFKFCRANLKPGGKMSLQTITWGALRAEQVHPFITNSIFPESNLPYPWEIFQAADRVMEVVHCRNDRLDYAKTCRQWLNRLTENRDAAVDAAGEEKVDQYQRFLKMSAAGFETGALHLYRVVLQCPVTQEKRA